MVPFREHQPAGEHLLGEQAGSGIGRGRLDPAGFQREVAELQPFLRENPAGGGIEEHPHVPGEILREQFLEPGGFDGGGEGEQGLDFAAAAADLADFRGDEQRAVLDDAFAREQAATAMDDFTAQRAGIEASGDVIGEGEQHAPTQVGFVELALTDIQAFPLGQSEEGLEQGHHLSGGGGVDPHAPAGVQAEVVCRGVFPGLHQMDEVRLGLVPDAILAHAGGVGVDATQEQVAALGQGSNQGGGTDAAQFVGGQEQPGVARVHREGEHPAAERGDVGVVAGRNDTVWGVDSPGRCRAGR